MEPRFDNSKARFNQVLYNTDKEFYINDLKELISSKSQATPLYNSLKLYDSLNS